MDQPIPSRKPDLVIINKKQRTCHLVHFAESVNKRKRKDEKIPGSCLRAEKKPPVKHESDGDTNCSWCT